MTDPGFAIPPAQNSTHVRTSSMHLPFGLRLARAGLLAAAAVAPRWAARWGGRLFLTPPRHSAPEREGALLAGGRRLDARDGGRRVAAWEWGTGPVVLLVHGWGGRGAQLGAFVPPLVAAGFRVVAFDHLGHGASEGRLNSALGFARTLAAVADAATRKAGLPLHGVVAHSLGGLGTILALTEGLPARRVVLVSAPSDPAGATRRFAAALGLPDALVEPIRLDVERRVGASLSAEVARARAAQVRAEVLVCHDREDPDVPWSDGVALAAAVPGARLLPTAGLGHRRILRDERVIHECTRFLKEETVMTKSLSTLARVSLVSPNATPADAAPLAPRVERACSTPGCKGRVLESWEPSGRLCGRCALEHDLFDRDARWEAPAALRPTREPAPERPRARVA
ncbi:MAG: alpha/beta fold hydrolase [Planctomycetes bacterium]|nr:alpha/beta fold hydrolase [Planctomycetota bacterium]